VFVAMSCKLVVLGAGGLVGARFCRIAVKHKEVDCGPSERLPLSKLCLVDMRDISGSLEPEVAADSRVRCMTGDLTDPQFLEQCIDPEGCTRVVVLHLAALLSGYAEENFDLGMQVNLQGPIGVMNAIRKLGETLGSPQVYVFVSTDYVTCFNEQNKQNPTNEESFRLSPVSYGVQKACVELLLCDYSRKGFIDGRVFRLSAVLGRPGWSNSISYPYTGIFTQPLEGKDYGVPLPMDIPYPCSDLNNNVEGLWHMCTALDGSKLDHNRVVQGPAKSYTLAQIWAACQEVAKEETVPLGTIHAVQAAEGTTTVKEINVCPFVDCAKAERLGFPMKVEIKEIIRDYIHNYVKK